MASSNDVLVSIHATKAAAEDICKIMEDEKEIWSRIFQLLIHNKVADQGSLRSTGVDGSDSGTRMELLKTIKKEEDSIVKDECLDNAQLPLRGYNVNETTSIAAMNWPDVAAAPKSLNIISTRNSARVAGRKDAAVMLSREKRKRDEGSAANKFHELKKSNGSPAQRSRCVTCFNRTILESERMPKPKTKWVTTFCGDCPGNPFLCILCFSKIHCNT